jgi:membrane dipeptidase
MGVLVDLSHVGHQTTLDAIEHANGPVVISHANVYRINPIPRNKTDDEIRALADKGGVMGITSVSRLMSAHGNERGTDLSEFIDQIDYVAELVGIDHVGIGLDIAEGMTAEDFARRKETFLARFPELKAGGDFPLEHYFTRGLSSAREFPNITEGLTRRGYSAEDTRKVIGGNFMRVFESVWKD